MTPILSHGLHLYSTSGCKMLFSCCLQNYFYDFAVISLIPPKILVFLFMFLAACRLYFYCFVYNDINAGKEVKYISWYIFKDVWLQCISCIQGWSNLQFWAWNFNILTCVSTVSESSRWCGGCWQIKLGWPTTLWKCIAPAGFHFVMIRKHFLLEKSTKTSFDTFTSTRAEVTVLYALLKRFKTK